MAASAWSVFREAKKNLGSADINLSTGTFKLCLIQSGATMLSANSSASTWASLKTDGVTEFGDVGGYSSSGITLAAVSWTRSGTTIKFDCTDVSLSATAALSSIRAAVIREDTGDHLVCYSSLSTAAFDLLSGNKLTIQMNASGIFTLA